MLLCGLNLLEPSSSPASSARSDVASCPPRTPQPLLPRVPGHFLPEFFRTRNPLYALRAFRVLARRPISLSLLLSSLYTGRMTCGLFYTLFSSETWYVFNTHPTCRRVFSCHVWFPHLPGRGVETEAGEGNLADDSRHSEHLPCGPGCHCPAIQTKTGACHTGHKGKLRRAELWQVPRQPDLKRNGGNKL